MGSDVPLLNVHKQEFLSRRLPQTILGGPRLKLGHSAPWYIYVNQIVLFLVPWVLGGVGTLLHQLSILEESGAVALSGGLMLAAATIIQAIALYAKKRTTSVERVQIHNILTDEDEWEFSSCLDSETMTFIIPGKKYVINVICHSVLAGVLCALGTWYLLPYRIVLLYDDNIGASVAVFVFGWMTVCIGEYSLIINTPSETAAFQALDTYEITPLMRLFYISAFVAVDIAHRFIGDVPDLKMANQILHIVFLVLPVLWTLGILPPLDALFIWALEQVHEIALGGSPMSNNLRLLAMVLISVGTTAASYFIPSSIGVVLFMTGVGFALSLNLSEIGLALKDVVINCLPSKKCKGACAYRMQVRWRSVIFHFTVFTGALLEAGFLHHGYSSLVFTITCLQATMSYVLVGLLLATWILREIQTVYMFGIFRNPFYPKDITPVKVFLENQKGLSVISFFQRILTNLVSPLAMVAFLSLDSTLHRLPSVYISIGLSRSYRMVWQNTECALLDIVIVSAIQLVQLQMYKPNFWWQRNFDMGTRLLMVAFIRNRLFQFVSKLRFVLTILVTSWTEKKQRRKSSAPLIILNAVFFPVVLALIALSALLSSPLLPLFSLPIFLIGFPRPIRSWPGPVGMTACICHDTVYYQQMAPNLAVALQAAFSSGSLGLCLPGSHYLCRFQDRLVWILVLERGFSYCCVSIKGLELQETSCHAAEASRVDEIFETAFENGEHTQSPSINRHFGNILTPCTVLPVKVYSDARSTLSGLIDSPDHRRQLKEDFIKALLWILVPHCYKKIKTMKLLKEAAKCALPRKPLDPNTLPGLKKALEKTLTLKEKDRLGVVSVCTDDSNLLDPESGRRASEEEEIVPTPVSSLPGSADTLSIENELAEPDDANKLCKVVTLGFPAVDKGKLENVILPRPSFNNPYCEVVSIPEQWNTVPLSIGRFDEMRHQFPEDWFHFVLRHLYFSHLKDDHFSLLGDLIKDTTLRDVYLDVVLSCCIAMFGSDSILSPGQIFRTYNGGIPWSICMDWLMAKPELFQVALKAFRYAVKHMIDKASLGPVETFKELMNCLEKYDTEWYIGLPTEKEWQEAVLQEKPHLFALGHDANMGVYTSRLLTLQETLMPVGKLSGEAVRGQWANLSWEMLYATNDDDERFSIQAHPVLLRNLTIQAADPPLGYPVYSSEPLHVSLL